MTVLNRTMIQSQKTGLELSVSKLAKFSHLLDLDFELIDY